MINHARTLILNEAAGNRPNLEEYGEEYVPSSFRPKRLSGPIKRLREICLGTKGDPLYQNYMLADIMNVLHSGNVSRAYILSLDPRYTYDVSNYNLLSQDFGTVVTALSSSAMSLNTSGVGRADDVTGVASFSWGVVTLAGGKVEITNNVTQKKREENIVVSSGLTNNILLEDGTSMYFSVPGSWEPNKRWTVISVARPGKGLGGLLREVDEDAPDTAANILSNTDKNFTNLWVSGVSVVDRLSGLLSAMVYKLERL